MSLALAFLAACSKPTEPKGNNIDDSGDTGGTDTGGVDTGGRDTGGIDTGGRDTGGVDTGGTDTGGVDTGGTDTGGIDTGVVGDCGETIVGNEHTFAVTSQADIEDAIDCFASSYSAETETLVLSLQNDIFASVSFTGLNVKILGNNTYGLYSNDSSTGSAVVEVLGGSLTLQDIKIHGLDQSIGVYATDSAVLSVIDSSITNTVGAGIFAEGSAVVEVTDVTFENLSNAAQAAIYADAASSVDVHGMTITDAESEFALDITADSIVLSGVRIDGEDAESKSNNFALGGLELSSTGTTEVDSLYLVDSDLGNGNVLSFTGTGAAYVRNTTFVELSAVDTVFRGAMVVSNGVNVDVDMSEFSNGTSYVGYQTFDGDYGVELPEGDAQMDDAAGTLTFTTANGFDYEVDYTTSGGDVTNGIASDPAAGDRGAHSGRGAADLATQ